MRLLLLLIFAICFIYSIESSSVKTQMKSASSLTNHKHQATASNVAKPQPPQSNNRVLRSGIFGGIGGILQVVTLMWLRTLTSYQYRYGISMLTAMKELYADGGVARFYRGWQYAIIQGPVSRFASVASNELANVIFITYFATMNTQLSQVLITCLGGLFVTLWRAFLMPIDTCKTVAQVEGSKGLAILLQHVFQEGNIGVLYQGTLATVLAAFIGHYPWFLVHNYLELLIPKPVTFQSQLLRNACIGFLSTAASDICSNSLRVIKTVKQATMTEDLHLTYWMTIQKVYQEGGLTAIFGRGLASRILSNGLQGVIFTIVWKYLLKICDEYDLKQASKKAESSTKLQELDEEKGKYMSDRYEDIISRSSSSSSSSSSQKVTYYSNKDNKGNKDKNAMPSLVLACHDTSLHRESSYNELEEVVTSSLSCLWSSTTNSQPQYTSVSTTTTTAADNQKSRNISNTRTGNKMSWLTSKFLYSTPSSNTGARSKLSSSSSSSTTNRHKVSHMKASTSSPLLSKSTSHETNTQKNIYTNSSNKQSYSLIRRNFSSIDIESASKSD